MAMESENHRVYSASTSLNKTEGAEVEKSFECGGGERQGQ